MTAPVVNVPHGGAGHASPAALRRGHSAAGGHAEAWHKEKKAVRRARRRAFVDRVLRRTD